MRASSLGPAGPDFLGLLKNLLLATGNDRALLLLQQGGKCIAMNPIRLSGHISLLLAASRVARLGIPNLARTKCEADHCEMLALDFLRRGIQDRPLDAQFHLGAGDSYLASDSNPRRRVLRPAQ